jgi:IS5 family transposase
VLLDKMDGLIPSHRLQERVEPFYCPKPGRARRPYPLGVVRRVHLVRLVHYLGHPGMGDLLHEEEPVGRFPGLQRPGALPEETPALTFRHLRGKHGQGEEQIWRAAGYQVEAKRGETRDVETAWPATLKAGRHRRLDKAGTPEAVERRKAPLRAKVEHPSLAVRRHFGYVKVR